MTSIKKTEKKKETKQLTYKSYCSTVHFRRITSIYQITNAHMISHKTLLKHFKTLQNTPTCFVGMCCGALARCASYDAHLANAPQYIPTQHDMLPQHLVCKYELNCEYCNTNLARNKAPWWWSDKIEICRRVLKCFKRALYEIICAFIGWQIEVKLTYITSTVSFLMPYVPRPGPSSTKQKVCSRITLAALIN